MKILVTGGAGFIGSNFVRYWLKNHPDDTLVNLDALTYAGNLASLADIVNDPETASRYKFVHGDITDRSAVREAMKGVDVVAHFAANSHVDRSIAEPDIFVKTNVVGTQILLDEAKRANVWRFHHVSTDEVYGTLQVEGDELFTEESRYLPNNPYSASKAGSDCIVRSYHQTYGLPATITNTSNNFGPYQFPEKYIPLCITRLIDGKNIRVHGKGDHIRDWLYVEDHCRAIEQVLRRGKMGEVYLVAGRAQLSILEVAQRICKIMGVTDERIEFVPDRPSNDKAYKLDWSKINRELGWEPQFSFDQWLEKTIAWYHDNEAWWRPLVKDSFSWGSEGHKTEQLTVSFNVTNKDGLVQMEKTATTITMNEPAQQATYGDVTQKLSEDLNLQPSTTAPKNALVFGKGQMSLHFSRYFQTLGYNVKVVGRPDVDIANFEQVKAAIASSNAQLVINCAGVTNVDWAEANKEQAYASNVIGADNLGRACQELDVYLVHLSSGCVHNSENIADVRTEESVPNPLCYYSETKVAADNILLERMKNNGLKVLIARPRQLLSAVPHPKNVLAKMLIYKKFHNNPNSMTVIEDLVYAVGELVKMNKTGLYNVANPGVTTPYEIAGLLKETINPDMEISVMSKDEIDAMYSVKRADTILSTEKLKNEGVILPEIHERLRQIIPVLRDNLLSDSAKMVLQEAANENNAKMQQKQTQTVSDLLDQNQNF